jgi:hypothetical protein
VQHELKCWLSSILHKASNISTENIQQQESMVILMGLTNAPNAQTFIATSS